MEFKNDLVKKTFEFSNYADDGKKKVLRKFNQVNYDATVEEQMQFGELLSQLLEGEGFSQVYQIVKTVSAYS